VSLSQRGVARQSFDRAFGHLRIKEAIAALHGRSRRERLARTMKGPVRRPVPIAVLLCCNPSDIWAMSGLAQAWGT